jgi:DNA-binding transcriptional LysR family regulator
MQVRRLEDAPGRSLLVRDGRASRLSRDGERLLVHARRMVKLNEEALSAFRAPDVEGAVWLGTPDDYADRFLAGHISRSLQSAGAQRAAAE